MSILENIALCLLWFVTILMSELRYEMGRLTLQQFLFSGLLTPWICIYILGLWGPLTLECLLLFFKRVWEIYLWANTDIFREQNYFSYLQYEVKTFRWAITSVMTIAARGAIDLIFREQWICTASPAVTHSSEKQPWPYREDADFPVFRWMKS